MNDATDNRKDPLVFKDPHLFKEQYHDPYHMKGKIAEPAFCPQCRAVYHKGSWHWTAVPKGAHEHVCPACQRIKDRVPGGYLNLSGTYLAKHRDEILSLARNVEEREKANHPLNRIMGTEDTADGVQITFTDQHLARAVGEAVHHAHQGELDIQYTKEGNDLRVVWRRT